MKLIKSKLTALFTKVKVSSTFLEFKLYEINYMKFWLDSASARVTRPRLGCSLFQAK